MSSELTRAQDNIDLIRSMIAPKANNLELQLFAKVADSLGLNPLANQIFLVARWDNAQRREIHRPQVSIDGMRIVAERSGKYAGQLGPFWCGDDGEWKDVWLSSEPPMAAKVGVLRSDFAEPLWAVARYGAYVQTKKDGAPNSVWVKMPEIMLAKCAESLALRKAFPNDLGGLHSREEMGQAENGKDDYVVEIPSELLSPATDANQPPQGEPLPFASKDAAIAWGMEKGVFGHVNHALNAYSKLKEEHNPTSAGEMFRLWKEDIERRIAEAEAEADATPVEEMESTG